MIEYRPFRISDLILLHVQPKHVDIRYDTLLCAAEMSLILEGPHSWTAWVGDISIGSAGITAGEHPMAWAFLGQDLRRHMVAITRRVRAMLESHLGPVSMEIDEGFPPSVRWAKLLGFRRQGPGAWVFAP
jgi:hypothetical protein